MHNHDEILRKREYQELWVFRSGKDCSLIVVAHGEGHAYSDAKGKGRKFRHVWQIKRWLQQQYGIEVETLEVNPFLH